MTQILDTNDRKLKWNESAKYVHVCMKEYTSLPDVSEINDTAELSCLYT